MSVFRVGVAVRAWGRDLAAYASDHSTEVVVVRVRDRRGVLESNLDVVCLDMDEPWVDPALIASCRDLGVSVVAVHSSPTQEQRATNAGIEHRLRSDLPPDAMMILLERLRPVRDPTVVGDRPVLAWSRRSTRPAIAVGGACGVDVCEVAVALAAGLCGDGSTVLVDADDSRAPVAQRLGYAEVPNLLTVASGSIAAEYGPATAAVLDTGMSAPFSVLPGLPSPAADWSKLTPGDVERVVRSCEQHWFSTVVLTGAVVEDMSRWASRYGISRQVLGRAALVVGVCEASPMGVREFGEWLVQAAPQGTVLVVVSGLPPRSRAAYSTVHDALRSLCSTRVEVIAGLPVDNRSTTARWNGTLVDRGRWFRSMLAVVDDVAAVADDLIAATPAMPSAGVVGR